jgi:NADH-quinone oxidoreductase subunit A
MLFDLEVAFIFPWAVYFNFINLIGFWSMIFFFLLLTIGFIFEWKAGALDWA